MKNILLVLLSLSFALGWSCARDVVLKLDPVAPVLVLNASVTPEREVAAFLSKSWFLLDSVPEYDLPDQGVKVGVYVNNVYKGMMQRSDNPADTTEYKGQYKLPGCYVQAGDKVRLEAVAPGFDPVSAETRIPTLTEIASVDTASIITSDYYSPRFRVYLTLNDRAAERNYYRLVVERLVEYRKDDRVMWISSFCDNGWNPSRISGDRIDTDFRYSYFSLSYDDPVFQPGVPSLEEYDGAYCRGVFTDDMFDGKEYTVTSSFFPDYSLKADTMTVIVHYDIHLLSISEAYYNYLKMIRSIAISVGDAHLDGLLEPTATYSNVNGGFGVVTGFQTSTYRITMPFDEGVSRNTEWHTDTD